MTACPTPPSAVPTAQYSNRHESVARPGGVVMSSHKPAHPQVLLTRSAEAGLPGLWQDAAEQGVVLTGAEEGRGGERGVTCAIATLDIPAGASWSRRSQLQRELFEELSSLLPSMAQPSQVLVLVSTTGRTERQREQLYRDVAAILSWVEFTAQTSNGIDLAVNAIAVPGEAWVPLLAQRLSTHLRESAPVTSGVVIGCEKLATATIRAALTDVII